MTIHWDTSCIDWERRIVAGESLITFAPLFESEADAALKVFKSLRMVDVAGQPTFGEACDQWVFDFVSAIFGAYDPVSAKRLINEFFLLISKKNGKSTVAAGIMVTALLRNWRHSSELLILAPTIEVAQNSFKPARDMILADESLVDLLHIQENVRTITHLVTKATLKVVAADMKIVAGKKAAFVLVDELWEFGKRDDADALLREATGGLIARPEGFVIFLSTQADTEPAGVFKAKLDYYRDIRDGKVQDKRKLGVLYEFPEKMIEAKAYLLKKNFYITNPSIGRSVDPDWIEEKLSEAQRGDLKALTSFCAKHLNVQPGTRQRSDGWAGAVFWDDCAAPEVVTLEYLLENSEVIVAGIDGGGLDDLLGFCLMGKEKGTGHLLIWCRAWAHKIVFERRKEIASKLHDLEAEGTLRVVDLPGDDLAEVVDIICQVEQAGLLAEEQAIGVDRVGAGSIVVELVKKSIEIERIRDIAQGWGLNGAIKDTERNLAAGKILHDGSSLMSWCVGNARTEIRGNATTVNKAVSGTAKIDPLMAVFNCMTLMVLDPKPKRLRSVYEDKEITIL